MKTLLLDYYYQFQHYQVLITYKRMRNITYRYDASKNLFKVSAPIFTTQKKILYHLDQFAPSLLKKAHYRRSPFDNNNVYIFGKITPYIFGSKNKVYLDHLEFKNKEDINKLLKKILLSYVVPRVKYYEDLFNISHYKVSVKNMRTRHGSNSQRTRRLSFATTLVHYKYDVIDSVIIHELTHDKFFDHSKNFYNYLYEKCPRYKEYKKALDETNYEFE